MINKGEAARAERGGKRLAVTLLPRSLGENAKMCWPSHLSRRRKDSLPKGPLGAEAAMNIRGHHASRWSEPNNVLSDWWQRVRLRHELESLDDGILRDIGLTRDTERSETSKPYWMN